MNKDEMNRAIAEACGWTNVGIRLMRVHSGQPTLNGLPPDKQGPDANEWHYRNVPPYASCLNACAEFEHYLEFSPKVASWFGDEHHSSAVEAYMGHLFDIAKKDDWVFIAAKPEMRCEAFLRTLNLYQDTRES